MRHIANQNERFYYELQFIRFLGFCYQSWFVK